MRLDNANGLPDLTARQAPRSERTRSVFAQCWEQRKRVGDCCVHCGDLATCHGTDSLVALAVVDQRRRLCGVSSSTERMRTHVGYCSRLLSSVCSGLSCRRRRLPSSRTSSSPAPTNRLAGSELARRKRPRLGYGVSYSGIVGNDGLIDRSGLFSTVGRPGCD